jgi:predicted membrane protein
MEQKKPITHTTAGLLIAALIIIYAIITQFLGLTQQKGLSLLQYVIIIGGLIFFVNQYGKANNYTKSFGDLFAFGFKSTAVFTSIYIIFIIIFFLVFPDIKEKALETARQQMEQNGKLNDADVDRAVEMARKFFWVGVVGGSLLFFIIIGAIGSLIGAGITKKRPNNPFDQPSA